jgi:anti-anti-sigma factor
VEESVYYKSVGAVVYMRATGHATALVCPPLKTAVFERLDTAPKVEEIYLDLASCEYMDSTFLGLIVGTQKRFAKALGDAGKGKSIVLIGVNEACKGLLRTIGVLGMVELVDEAVPFPPDMQRLSGEARSSARFLLDAHEELARLSDENKRRFAGLMSVLRNADDEEEGKSDRRGE